MIDPAFLLGFYLFFLQIKYSTDSIIHNRLMLLEKPLSTNRVIRGLVIRVNETVFFHLSLKSFGILKVYVFRSYHEADFFVFIPKQKSFKVYLPVPGRE